MYAFVCLCVSVCICLLVSMSISDHLHSAKVHFYQLGLGSQNTVTDRNWKLMTLRSIQFKLGHTEVRDQHTGNNRSFVIAELII